MTATLEVHAPEEALGLGVADAIVRELAESGVAARVEVQRPERGGADLLPYVMVAGAYLVGKTGETALVLALEESMKAVVRKALTLLRRRDPQPSRALALTLATDEARVTFEFLPEHCDDERAWAELSRLGVRGSRIGRTLVWDSELELWRPPGRS